MCEALEFSLALLFKPTSIMLGVAHNFSTTTEKGFPVFLVGFKNKPLPFSTNLRIGAQMMSNVIPEEKCSCLIAKESSTVI